MLSRIAESLYWVGRYNERSEAAARILDVYAHSLLEDRLGDEEAACARLLDALGVGEMAPEIGADVDELISFVIDDPRYDGSIVGSLQAAWENARGAREAISSEMVPIQDAVNIPFVQQFLDDGVLTPNEIMTSAAKLVLDELVKLSTALTPVRD